jgi:hypothetical protein
MCYTFCLFPCFWTVALVVRCSCACTCVVRLPHALSEGAKPRDGQSGTLSVGYGCELIILNAHTPTHPTFPTAQNKHTPYPSKTHTPTLTTLCFVYTTLKKLRIKECRTFVPFSIVFELFSWHVFYYTCIMNLRAFELSFRALKVIGSSLRSNWEKMLKDLNVK